MTDPRSADWWNRLCDLADNGPRDGEYAEAREFIEAAERMTAAARQLITPKAVSQPGQGPVDALPGDR